jgi:anti-sigma factor RsiW
MTCRELIERLAGYVDGDLPPDERAAIEEHLASCPSCQNYLASYQATIEMERKAFDTSDSSDTRPVPPELIQAVLAARRRPSKK